MMCAWKELLNLLPPGMRREVDTLGRDRMQELRLRCNAPPVMLADGQYLHLTGTVSQEELNYVVNAASRYSPWAAVSTASGYITAKGGHRIGLCGEVVCRNGSVEGFRRIRSLCIRIARDFPGIAEGIPAGKGSMLILGAPGWGKTTLLRDLIRQISKRESIGVVDEREELFPEGMDAGVHTDILRGCPKAAGVDMLLRTMSPGVIAVDEITEPDDCRCLIRSANCGVRLLATAHASSVQEFRKRPVYRQMWEDNLFETLVVLRRDKSYTVERMTL